MTSRGAGGTDGLARGPASGAPALSVVVPAFEEGAHVRAHLARIAAALDATGRAFEILLVDDGSTDATAAEAARAAAADPRVRVERHARNLGKGAALETGTRAARGDVVVYLDADLEISPEEVPPLLARFEREGADVLVGSKYAEGARERRPLHRVLLSRLYWLVTSLLFRLPIRDTQTGLKILDRALALAVIPAVRTRRWAWDIEVLVLAHRRGARIVSGPVSVDFKAGGARIGWRGVVASALDTLAVFLRARCLGAYGGAAGGGRADDASARPRGRRPTEFTIVADDLGLSPSVDAGILDAVAAGRLGAVSALADGPTAAPAARELAGCSPAPATSVHLALGGARPLVFVAREVLSLPPPARVRAEVRRQVETVRARGLLPTRVDAHRHLAFPRATFRAVCAEARALGLARVRRPVPLGTLRVGRGAAGWVKGALLSFAGIATRGLPRAYGLAAPDGFADLEVVDGWVRRGRVPRAARGRRVEVVAHPARGGDDLPAAERGPDREGDARRLEGLRSRLEALGGVVLDGAAGARAPTDATRRSPG